MAYVPQLCTYVDDPDSSMAPVFDANLAAVKNTKLATDKVKTACSSSEKCSGYSPLSRAVVNWLSEGVVESIFDLEKELVDKEARVLQLKQEAA